MKKIRTKKQKCRNKDENIPKSEVSLTHFGLAKLLKLNQQVCCYIPESSICQ